MPIANLLDRLFGMKARATLLSALASVVFAPFLAVAAVKLRRRRRGMRRS
jgi:predicted NAD/FAD-dependent oxidoreductase